MSISGGTMNEAGHLDDEDRDDEQNDEEFEAFSIPPPLPPSIFYEHYFTVTDEKQSKTVKLQRKQMKAAVLGKIFSLFPDSIFLIDSDGHVVTASSSGDFADEISYGLDVENALTCHGDCINPISPINPIDQGGLTAAYQYSYQTNPLLTKKFKGKRPARNKLPPGVESQMASTVLEWTKTIEIFKRNSCASGGWEKVSNLPVRLTESKANLNDVCKIVSDEGFEGKEVVLLDVDFLKILDTKAAKGSNFWRTAKKFRAVLKSEYTRKREHEDSQGSSKSAKYSDDIGELSVRISKIEEKFSQDRLKMNKIRSCFKCVICLRVISTWPAVKSPCCGIVLGCQSCVAQWLTNKSNCPHCRANIDVNVSMLEKVLYLRQLVECLSENND
jgi:hypothetical protein